ncbi:winged helix-turn-helix domain-containing protein [Sphingobium sp. LSP13-1-1.1]|uniref:winged helix-turn-helix domain-containing protein n=1 Tax=Sphingobium sp. LSP13-1-1.1 TaxID=3135234 RepID=UPI00341879BE
MQMMKPDQFASWVARAAPGDDVVYSMGDRPEKAIGEAVRALHEQGLVALTSKRGANGFRFIAQRLPDPKPVRGPEHRGRYARREIKGRYTAERMILKILSAAAEKGQPCPTNAELARRVGLSGAVSASYRMRRLVAAGKIVVEEPSPLERRLVTIVATGKQTKRAML